MFWVIIVCVKMAWKHTEAKQVCKTSKPSAYFCSFGSLPKIENACFGPCHLLGVKQHRDPYGAAQIVIWKSFICGHLEVCPNDQPMMNQHFWILQFSVHVSSVSISHRPVYRPTVVWMMGAHRYVYLGWHLGIQKGLGKITEVHWTE